MAIERTFSIIKPDVVARNLIGDIYHRFENAGLRVIAAKMVHLNHQEAAGFYAHLRHKPFFDALMDFMMSGPIMVQVLEGEDAVRRLLGIQIPGTPELVRCGQTMPHLLIRMQCTDLTALRLPKGRFPISLPRMRSALALDSMMQEDTGGESPLGIIF